MKLLTHRLVVPALCLSALVACTESTPSGEPVEREDEPEDRYRLYTDFLGEERVLSARSVVGEPIGLGFEASGLGGRQQEWIFTDVGNGFLRITNRAFGETLALGVIDDGVFDRVTLSSGDDLPEQRWRVTPLDNGFCRFTTAFLGPELALDVTSDTATRDLTIRSIGNFSGQSWALVGLDPGAALEADCPGTPRT